MLRSCGRTFFCVIFFFSVVAWACRGDLGWGPRCLAPFVHAQQHLSPTSSRRTAEFAPSEGEIEKSIQQYPHARRQHIDVKLEGPAARSPTPPLSFFDTNGLSLVFVFRRRRVLRFQVPFGAPSAPDSCCLSPAMAPQGCSISTVPPVSGSW